MSDNNVLVAIIAATPPTIGFTLTYLQARGARQQAIGARAEAASANAAVNHKSPSDLHLVQKVDVLMERSAVDEELRQAQFINQKHIRELVEALRTDLTALQAQVSHNGERFAEAMVVANANHEAITQSAESLRVHAEEDMVVFRDLLDRLERLSEVIGDPRDWFDEGGQRVTFTDYVRELKHSIDAGTRVLLDDVKLDIITKAMRIIREYEASTATPPSIAAGAAEGTGTGDPSFPSSPSSPPGSSSPTSPPSGD